MSGCSFNGCELPHVAKGWCDSHYRQWRKRGTVARIKSGPEPSAIGFVGPHAEIIIVDRHGLEKARAIIDMDDVDAVKSRRWWCDAQSYVISATGPRTTIALHRLITGAPSGMVVDHWNGNPLDNRRENLRVVPQRLNVQNAQMRSDNSSGYRGVSYNPDERKWYARVHHEGKTIRLGQFDDVHEAGRVAHEARELFFENHQTRDRGQT